MILLTLVMMPIIAGLAIVLAPVKWRWFSAAVALAATLLELLLIASVFKQYINLDIMSLSLAGPLSLRLYNFSAFIVLAIAAFSFLVTLYSTVFLAGKNSAKLFFAYLLLNEGLAAGAVLSNNLILFLFFWEGLLLTLFGLIYLGGQAAFKTAIKAFIIIGITDLCLLLGIAITGQLAGTYVMSQISLPLTALGSAAFLLMMIGAIAKGGSMPFHSWIPDAALDAPLPFMALVPAAMEKLLGIYFLTRICLDLFRLTPDSWLSPLLMTIGGLTIILAVMMALVQKDFKRLLSYHAISQVGYMILGVGTALPVGIIGGLFHMINNALYKSCLFMTGGAVERQTGTTDLSKLGGLAWQMPLTFACFFIAAVSISGVPPFNGFFSKELIYDAALERGWIFYLLAVAGSFFTAASFLKLGHAAFFDKQKNIPQAKEVSWPMIVPMVVIALVCVLFGVFNVWPIQHLLQPILGEARLEGHNFSGWPTNLTLVLITLLVLLGAIANHYYGVKKTGRGAGAVDHIHYAPGLASLYDRAEKRYFDPYELGLKLNDLLARCLYFIDRAIDWLYEVATVRVTLFFSRLVSLAHSGNFAVYVIWSLVGAAVVIIMMLRT